MSEQAAVVMYFVAAAAVANVLWWTDKLDEEEPFRTVISVLVGLIWPAFLIFAAFAAAFYGFTVPARLYSKWQDRRRRASR